MYLVLLVAPVAILIEEHHVQQEIGSYLAGEDRGSLFRAEVEYLATLATLYRAEIGEPDADRRAVERAIDLLYSRYDVLKGKAVGASFGNLPAYHQLMQSMDRMLGGADAILAGEVGPEISPAGLRALIDEVKAVEEPLRVLLRDALMQTARKRDALREHAETQRSLHQLATGALIVASVGFIGALVWNVRQLRVAGSRLSRLTDAVRQSEARLSLIADSLPMLIGYVEVGGRVLFVNRTGQEWVARRAEGVIGESIGALLGTAGDEAMQSSIAEAAAGRLGHFEGRLAFPDGVQRVVEATFIPDIADGQVRGMFVVMIDITARKESEDQLRQALKLEAVGRLTGGVAHDFNNLLGVVVGNLDLARIGLAGRPRELSLVKRALAAAERGAAVTQRLLAFSRRQMLSPRLTDVNRLVLELADTLLPTLGEAIEIVTIPCRESCIAYIDANQLEAAILNLAVNARDAMEDGGRLTIGTAVAMFEEENTARPRDLPAGEYVVISITDTGSGMPPGVARRAFEPFFTTKRVGEGSGLGLSVVFGFMKQSGGHVELDSREGIGTTVRLYLPRATGMEIAEAGLSEAVPAASGGGCLVLVVEDDGDLLAFSTAALNSLGYRALGAKDARSALAQLEKQPDVSVLLTDIVLPGSMDGVRLAEEAQRRRPGLKVLFTSGYAGGDPPCKSPLPAETEPLVKPFRVEDLNERLGRILASQG